jgi:hypothetical protein
VLLDQPDHVQPAVAVAGRAGNIKARNATATAPPEPPAGAVRAGCVTSDTVRTAMAEDAGQGRGGYRVRANRKPSSRACTAGWRRAGSRARAVSRRATGVWRRPSPAGFMFARQAQLSSIQGGGTVYRALEEGCLNRPSHSNCLRIRCVGRYSLRTRRSCSVGAGGTEKRQPEGRSAVTG